MAVLRPHHKNPQSNGFVKRFSRHDNQKHSGDKVAFKKTFNRTSSRPFQKNGTTKSRPIQKPWLKELSKPTLGGKSIDLKSKTDGGVEGVPDGLVEWLTRFTKDVKWYDVVSNQSVPVANPTSISPEWVIPVNIEKRLAKGGVVKSFHSLADAVEYIESSGKILCAALSAHFDKHQGILDSQGRFLRNSAKKGTQADMLSALVLLVQQMPFATKLELEKLLSITANANLKTSLTTLEALKDLMINDLLPPKRKLFSIQDNPLLSIYLSNSKDSQQQNGTTSSKHHIKGGPLPKCHYVLTAQPHHILFIWYEAFVKTIYAATVKAFGELSSGFNEFGRHKAITSCCELLVNRPEQEEALLACLINKLSDNNNKAAAAAEQSIRRLFVLKPDLKMQIVDSLWRTVYLHSNTTTTVCRILTILCKIPLRRNDSDTLSRHLVVNLLDLFDKCFDDNEIISPKTKLRKRPPIKFDKSNNTDDRPCTTVASMDVDVANNGLCRHSRVSVASKFMLRARRSSRSSRLQRNVFTNGKDRGRGIKKHRRVKPITVTKPFHSVLSGCGYIEEGNRIVKLCLSGLSRVIPYLAHDTAQSLHLENKFAPLFRICTSSMSASVRVYAVAVLARIAQLTGSSFSDQFYRMIYDTLRYINMFTSASIAVYLRVIKESLIEDVNVTRVSAVLRRLLQVISHCTTPGLTVEATDIISSVISSHPSINQLLVLGDKALTDIDGDEILSDAEDNLSMPTTIPLPTNITSSCNNEASTRQYDPSHNTPQDSNAMNAHLWEVELWRTSLHPTVSVLSKFRTKDNWNDITGVIPLTHQKSSMRPYEKRHCDTSLTVYSSATFLQKMALKTSKGIRGEATEGLSTKSLPVNDIRRWENAKKRQQQMLKNKNNSSIPKLSFVGDRSGVVESHLKHNNKGLTEYLKIKPDEWFLGDYYLDDFVWKTKKAKGRDELSDNVLPHSDSDIDVSNQRIVRGEWSDGEDDEILFDECEDLSMTDDADISDAESMSDASEETQNSEGEDICSVNEEPEGISDSMTDLDDDDCGGEIRPKKLDDKNKKMGKDKNKKLRKGESSTSSFMKNLSKRKGFMSIDDFADEMIAHSKTKK